MQMACGGLYVDCCNLNPTPSDLSSRKFTRLQLLPYVFCMAYGASEDRERGRRGTMELSVSRSQFAGQRCAANHPILDSYMLSVHHCNQVGFKPFPYQFPLAVAEHIPAPATTQSSDASTPPIWQQCTRVDSMLLRWTMTAIKLRRGSCRIISVAS